MADKDWGHLTLMVHRTSGRPTPQKDWGIHPNITCDNCNSPVGKRVRFKCLYCADFDLCSDCEPTAFQIHFGGRHLFMKVRDSRVHSNDAINSYVKQ